MRAVRKETVLWMFLFIVWTLFLMIVLRKYYLDNARVMIFQEMESRWHDSKLAELEKEYVKLKDYLIWIRQSMAKMEREK